MQFDKQKYLEMKKEFFETIDMILPQQGSYVNAKILELVENKDEKLALITVIKRLIYWLRFQIGLEPVDPIAPSMQEKLHWAFERVKPLNENFMLGDDKLSLRISLNESEIHEMQSYISAKMSYRFQYILRSKDN